MVDENIEKEEAEFQWLPVTSVDVTKTPLGYTLKYIKESPGFYGLKDSMTVNVSSLDEVKENLNQIFAIQNQEAISFEEFESRGIFYDGNLKELYNLMLSKYFENNFFKTLLNKNNKYRNVTLGYMETGQESKEKYLVWKDGTWLNGIWFGGVWENGTWHDGEWNTGVWKNGGWYCGVWWGGIWEQGRWYGGTWKGGTWYGGTWKNGTWKGGIWKDGKVFGGFKSPELKGKQDV